MVERRSSSMTYEGRSSSIAGGLTEGGKPCDIGESLRPNGVGKREGQARDESFEVVNSLNNTWIKGRYRFILTLFEVRQVDGGCAGSADRAPGLEEGVAELVPVVTVNTGATERVIPQKGIATESVIDERVGMIFIPSRRNASPIDAFDPLFSREGILGVAGEERELSEVGLSDEVSVDEDVSHGSGVERLEAI